MKTVFSSLASVGLALAAFSVRADAPADANGVVSFKDAAKIKSWDAWSDHVKKAAPTSILQKERTCVTWKALNELDPGLREIGRLAVRNSKDVKASSWSVGCETMDRDYAEWNSFKELLPLLGVKHARFFSGWAKTEQEKGKYDFTWLDPQLRESAAMGVKPWVCLSYGNPVWGSDFRLGMRVKQVTDNAEAFEAWLRYCKACVTRYKDVVDEWEIWNEPFHQGREYAEMVYRTAKAIHEVQPGAKCFVTAISWNKDPAKNDYAIVAEKLKKENALDLVTRWIYHPYQPNPDLSYASAERLRAFVKGYSPKFDIMQGEVGCPAQLEFAHAMHSIEWTEYSQAKWDLRRTIGDFSRDIPCNVFTMIDLQYTFMLQSFGLVRSNTLKEFVYRRPSFYAMQNVFNLLDCDAKPDKMDLEAPFTMNYWWDARNAKPRQLTCSKILRKGKPLWFFWFAQDRPGNQLGFDRVKLPVWGRIENPVWVDMITGRVFEIPASLFDLEETRTVFRDLPMWDSPVLIADRSSVELGAATR